MLQASKIELEPLYDDDDDDDVYLYKLQTRVLKSCTIYFHIDQPER
jgi:hypothetical protein